MEISSISSISINSLEGGGDPRLLSIIQYI